MADLFVSYVWTTRHGSALRFANTCLSDDDLKDMDLPSRNPTLHNLDNLYALEGYIEGWVDGVVRNSLHILYWRRMEESVLDELEKGE